MSWAGKGVSLISGPFAWNFMGVFGGEGDFIKETLSRTVRPWAGVAALTCQKACLFPVDLSIVAARPACMPAELLPIIYKRPRWQ